MGIAQYDPAAMGRSAWNVGRKVGVKKPLKQRQFRAIRFFLDREGRMRDRALFDFAIDSKLRGCETVIQRKTGRPVQFEITAEVRASLLAWLQRRGGTIDDFAFPSRVHHADHLSTRQYARLVDEWVTAVGLRREDYGTYSLRRTNAAMSYREPSCDPDSARSHQNREHGQVSVC